MENVAVNPLSHPISAQVQTNLVEMKEVAFHFRKDKDLEEKNPSLVGKTKRKTFKRAVPHLTKAGVIAAMGADDKSTQLIVDLANEAIIDRLRGLINEKVENDKYDPEAGYSVTLSQDMFSDDTLSFLAIANLPKSERGAGIPKEAWESFVADYKETLKKPEAVALLPDRKPRAPEIIEKHGIILMSKYNAVRSRKDVLAQMQGFLDVWVQVSPNADEHVQCYEHLKAKGDALLQAENFDDL